MKKIPVFLTLDNEEVRPIYSSDLAAGADAKANILENVAIQPHTSALIPTGIKVEIPRGFEIQVRPRSGLALKHMVTVLNTPGTIDADYRGEIKIILINHGNEVFIVTPKMRVAQLVLAPVFQAQFELKEELAHSARGEKGFGHTGTH